MKVKPWPGICRVRGSLLVGDSPFVGSLGVLGDLSLDGPALLAAGGRVPSVRATALMARFELDGADLFGQRGRERVAVVLFADADTVVASPQPLVAQRGAPTFLRIDNGPKMTAHALQGWCHDANTATAFIDPGSPWQNPFVKSFQSRVRHELLDIEEFACLAEARVVIEDWREEYNTMRPHSSLGMRAPTVFAAEWTPVAPTVMAATAVAA